MINEVNQIALMKTAKHRVRRSLRNHRPGFNGRVAPIRPPILPMARKCPEATSVRAVSKGHETILVVHPLQPKRETVADAVRQFGYRVVEATSALQAQSRIKTEPGIRLVIMEFPELEFDGLQTALWFAGNNPQMKVLLASSRIWNISLRPGDFEQITVCPAPLCGSELARLVRRTLE
jgi:hypothetical protein